MLLPPCRFPFITDTAVWIAAVFTPTVNVIPSPPAAWGLNSIRLGFGVGTLNVTFSSYCLPYLLLPCSPYLCFIHVCFLIDLYYKACKSFGMTCALYMQWWNSSLQVILQCGLQRHLKVGVWDHNELLVFQNCASDNNFQNLEKINSSIWAMNCICLLSCEEVMMGELPSSPSFQTPFVLISHSQAHLAVLWYRI